MSSSQFQFAAQFVTFLAATAGLAIVVLRGELLARAVAARVAIGLGFALLGTAAFLSGSLLLAIDEAPVIALHGAGIAIAFGGTATWTGSRAGRRLLWAGLALMAGSVALRAGVIDTSWRGDVADGALALGAAGVVAALLAASRKSISARVAASAAGTLLLVVLVLSIALSTVLSSTVEDEAIRRLDARASTEAGLLRTQTEEVRGRADFASRVLANDPDTGQLLLDLADQPRSSAAIDRALADAGELFKTFPVKLGYVTRSFTPVGSAGFSEFDLVKLASTDVVRAAGRDLGHRSSIEVVGARAVVVAASPVSGPAEDLLGLVIAATDLDDTYLSSRAADDAVLSLAIYDSGQQLADIGEQPEPNDTRELVALVLEDGNPRTHQTAGRFVAVRAVPADDGRPIVAVVASTPTTLVGQTRDSLFRTLFLIALGGTLLALLAAAVVGERIGGGLRRLTLAAEAIERGDLSVRAGLESDDEVGVLGRTFDSMAGSIETQTAALVRAADDETRLRNRLEAVVAGMGEALVAIDREGLVTDFNQAAEELLGVSAADARGRRAEEVLRLVGEDGVDLSRRLRKASPSRWTTIATLTRDDRTNVPVAASSGILRGPASELVGNVLVLRDLRREREVERMKTEFLSRVGHELRTPLTGIRGFAEILAHRDVPTPTARTWHEEIIESSNRLLRIVEMLEFFASSGAGRLALRREPVDLRSVVSAAVEQWRERVGSKWTISGRVARGAPVIHADKRWLATCLHELVDNAVKFSPGGGKVAMTVTAATRGRSRGVEIAVSDQGKGMTAEEEALAFAEFVQGDSSDTRPFGGLGLGLPLVLRVVEAHGGGVSCTSKPGRGSTFTLFLPVGRAAA